MWEHSHPVAFQVSVQDRGIAYQPCEFVLCWEDGTAALQLLLLPTEDLPPEPEEKDPDLGAGTALVEPPTRLVTAVPAPAPPARPLTAPRTPMARSAGEAGVCDSREPCTVAPRCITDGGS